MGFDSVVIIRYLSLPIIAALIGWVTNWVAVKMLFHPREERRWLGVRVQGVFPKRQAVLAEKLGALVANELFSADDVVRELRSSASSPEFLSKLGPQISKLIGEIVPQKFPMASMFLTPELLKSLENSLTPALAPVLQQVLGELEGDLRARLPVEQLVAEKVRNFSSEKLEEILNSIMKTEFRFIELIGGVLGFAIGIVQVGILIWTV